MKKNKHLYLLPLIILSIIAYKMINEEKNLFGLISQVGSILVPFIWAIAIAYLLNPLMRFLEKKWKLKRNISITITIGFAILTITGIFFIIIPSVISSTADIIKELPEYGNKLEIWYSNLLNNAESIEKMLEVYKVDLKKILMGSLEKSIESMANNFQSYAVQLGQTLLSLTASFFKFLIGLALSVYMLKDKEKFQVGLKRLSLTFLGEKLNSKITVILNDIDEVFSKYIIGKTIDSLIIGIICLIGLSVLNVKFALLFSFIVGITNMIPYFGPFIGAVPAIIITLFINPLQALWVALFILALQQADGYIIGPLILGDSLGTSPFWIILAIVLGGSTFGFWGMLLGVPVVAVIRKITLRKVSGVLGIDESSLKS